MMGMGSLFPRNTRQPKDPFPMHCRASRKKKAPTALKYIKSKPGIMPECVRFLKRALRK
jgi:hypothetical protein